MLKTCRVCGLDSHLENSAFCQRCGVSLINYCENESCKLNNGEKTPLPDDANYCPLCGSTSLFNDFEER